MYLAPAQEKRRTRPRAGSYALSTLSVPLNVQLLEALKEQPTPLIALRRALGAPPPTTIRTHLRALADGGILERHTNGNGPTSVGYELGPPGRRLLEVADVVRLWLSISPDGPLALGSPGAKNAIKALVEGWSTAAVRALAARPLSLTELDRVIPAITYPSLERRLGAMRMAGQIEPRPSKTGTPYAVTSWLRRAAAPLAAAARWERENAAAGSLPVGYFDAEAIFLLASPLLRLDPGISGSCRLTVEIGNGESQRLSGAMVDVEDGRVVSCVSRLEGKPDASAIGPVSAWMAALIDGDVGGLELGGGNGFARDVLGGMHSGLFRYKLD